MKTQIEKILRKKISSDEKINLIKELLAEDHSLNLWINKLVKLSQEEIKKLESSYWKIIITEYIQRLDSYLYSTWRKYKSHYLTILNWLGRAKIEPIQKVSTWTDAFWESHKY